LATKEITHATTDYPPGAGVHPRPAGARVHNLKNISVEIPQQRHYRGHRRQRLRQVLPRVRHHFTRRASAATSNRFPPTPANFSSAWKKPDVDEISGDRAGGGDSAEKFDAEPAFETWRRPRKFTIICGCFLRAAERHFASSVEHRFERIAPDENRYADFVACGGGGVFYVLAPVFESSRPTAAVFETRRQEKPSALRLRMSFVKPCSIFRSAVSNRLYQAGRIHEFSSPETLLDVDFSKPVYVPGRSSRGQSRVARARLVDSIEICYREGAGRSPFSNLSRTVRGIPPSGSHSTNDSNARSTAHFTRNPSPGSSPSTIHTERGPRCQGFGNTIDFDLNLVVPDQSKSLDDGAIEPWTKPRYRRTFPGSKKMGRAGRGIPTNVAVAATHCRTAPLDSRG